MPEEPAPAMVTISEGPAFVSAHGAWYSGATLAEVVADLLEVIVTG